MIKKYEYKNKTLYYSVNDNKVFTSKIPTNYKDSILEIDTKAINYKIDKIKIVYILTGECNFRCSYCYENTSKVIDGCMNSQQMLTIFHAFKNYYGNDITYDISFFGGEPLLLKHEIISFVKQIDQLVGIKTTFSMITNGYLLDDEFIVILKDRFTALTISQDGNKAIHDANRKLRSGAPTFEQVSANIKKLSRELGELQLACELTVTSTYIKNYTQSMCKEIWDNLHNMRIKTASFIPDVNYNVFARNEKIMEDIISDLISLWIEDVINKGRYRLRIPEFESALASLAGKKNTSLFCSAGISYFAALPNNSVYSCQTSVFAANSNKIGYISREGELFHNTETFGISRKLDSKQCIACECLHMCNTFCKVVMNNQDQFTNSCLYTKMILKWTIYNLVNLYEDNRMAEFAANF